MLKFQHCCSPSFFKKVYFYLLPSEWQRMWNGANKAMMGAVHQSCSHICVLLLQGYSLNESVNVYNLCTYQHDFISRK